VVSKIFALLHMSPKSIVHGEGEIMNLLKSASPQKSAPLPWHHPPGRPYFSGNFKFAPGFSEIPPPQKHESQNVSVRMNKNQKIVFLDKILQSQRNILSSYISVLTNSSIMQFCYISLFLLVSHKIKVVHTTRKAIALKMVWLWIHYLGH
jgi:hypothetical protein